MWKFAFYIFVIFFIGIVIFWRIVFVLLLFIRLPILIIFGLILLIYLCRNVINHINFTYFWSWDFFIFLYCLDFFMDLKSFSGFFIVYLLLSSLVWLSAKENSCFSSSVLYFFSLCPKSHESKLIYFLFCPNSLFLFRPLCIYENSMKMFYELIIKESKLNKEKINLKWCVQWKSYF